MAAHLGVLVARRTQVRTMMIEVIVMTAIKIHKEIVMTTGPVIVRSTSNMRLRMAKRVMTRKRSRVA